MPDTPNHSEDSDIKEALGDEAVRRAQLLLENAKWFFENGVRIGIKEDRKAGKFVMTFGVMK